MKTRLLLLLLASTLSVLAQQRPATAPPPGGDWRTPAEISDFRTTPRYDETMQWVRRLAAVAPAQVRVESFGKSGEGRDLIAVIVSRDGVFDPVALHKANRPVVYIQNAIHAGEMDGKDASLALLRDILVTKKLASFIERSVLVVVPIYNVDGHEHFGPYNRINQNGPEQMGWRTNARQFNLNRDYMKADAPETRAFLKLWQRWLPDFFIDDHVTDGADYQYDITYFFDHDASSYAPLRQWLEKVRPEFVERIHAAGHLAAPYMDFKGSTPDSGIAIYQSTPRFATGYVNLQNRPSLLIEMHMLKDYRTRVTGNYESLKAVLGLVARDADTLVRLNREADAATEKLAEGGQVPLQMESSGATEPFAFKGYRWTTEVSDVSGAKAVAYTREPIEIEVPRENMLNVTYSATVPAAYIVPVEWTPVIDVLQAHGLKMSRTTAPWSAEVETYRCERPKWQENPFEGHNLAGWPSERLGPDGRACRMVREKMEFAAGSVVIPMTQRNAKIAVHFLEPEAPDSAIVWGMFNSIFEQKEYGESYVLEQLARKMLARDPKLKSEFEQKLASDKQFAANPYARLNWFYQRSPWWDKRIGLYPVARLHSLAGVPVEQKH